MRRVSTQCPEIPSSEILERRTLLSVTLTPEHYVTPANTPDIALGMAAGPLPPEPFVRINPTNPSNFVVASHCMERAFTDGGATVSTPTTVPPPKDSTTQAGRSGLAFDTSGSVYWVNAVQNVS